MKRLEGGYLGGRPTWSLASNPGIWGIEQVFARRAAGTWPIGAGSFDEYYEYVTFMLHANGANASTSFPDSSLYGRSVSVFGNAQVSTTQSKFGGASIAFDGNGDYLTATSDGFLFGTGDFSIELWFNVSVAFSATSQTFAGVWGSSSKAWILQATSTSVVCAFGNGAAYVNQITGNWTAPSTGTWNHLAVTRSGTTAYIFLNGVQLATTTITTNISGVSTLSIGINSDGNQQYITGYIDELRITKGYARYTSNFSVPTGPYEDEGAPLADPFYNSVSLLLPMNGSNNSTTFTDKSPNALTVTANGDAKLSTAVKRYGVSSAAFDGTGDYLSLASSSQIDLGSSDFTIEFWVQFSSLSGIIGLLGKRAAEANYSPFLLEVNTSTLRLSISTTGSSWAVNGLSSGTLTIGQWYHIAIVRSGTVVYMFVNGTSVGSTGSVSGALMTNATAMTIGRGAVSISASVDLNGYIDDLRITKGVARYLGNFIPPLPHADYGTLADSYLAASSLWMPMEGPVNSTGFFDRADRQIVTTVGNAKISNAQYKWGLTSAAFDGNGDYLTIPSSTVFDLGTDYTIEFWVYPAITPNYNFGLVHRGFYSTVTSNWTGLAFSIRCLGSNGAGNLRFYFYATTNASEQVINTTGSLSAGRWTHIAMTRVGTTGYAFVDGVLVGTITSLSTPAASNETLRIGRWDYSAGNEDFNGYIDDLRIIKGHARYTTSFTPPTAPINADTSSDPYLSNVSLLLKMDGANNSTAFTDSSLTPKTVFANGDAKISTAQSKFGGSSALFDGTGDYLAIPTSSAFAFGGADFTIEFWVFRVGAGQQHLYEGRNGNATNTGLIYIDSALELRYYVNAATAISTGYTVPANVWIHVALSRSGSSTKMFVNGAQVGSTYTDTINYNAPAGSVLIGTSESAGGQFLNGYIDDLRVTKGVARYTANFIPPTISHPVWSETDASFSSVSLLLNGNGANASTIIADRSSNTSTVVPNGNAQISTTQSRFGGSSLYFDGTGDFLTAVDAAALEPGASSLTWEMWIKTTSSTQYATLYSRTPNTFASGMWALMMNYATATTGDLALFIGDFSTGSPLLTTSGVSVRNDVWHHVAVVRDGSAWAIYVDGISRATATWSGTIADISGSIYIGRDQFYTRDYLGYIDDLRITKGVARYTANFTPPIAPHPIPVIDPYFGAVSLLLHMNGANASTTFSDHSYNALAVTANGNAQISTAQSKFGGASAAFDGTGDLLTLASSPLFGFGTGDFTCECWIYLTSTSDQNILDFRTATNAQTWVWAIISNALYLYAPSGTLVAGTTALATNQWYHIAITRSGGTIRHFLNGVLDGSGTNASDFQSSRPLTIGGTPDASSGMFTGYIDDLRITKGIARYTSTFTPPTTPFPNS